MVCKKIYLTIQKSNKQKYTKEKIHQGHNPFSCELPIPHRHIEVKFHANKHKNYSKQ